MTTVDLLKLAAIAHVGLLAAGACMPQAVNLWAHTRELPIFIRNLLKVYYVFIGFVLASFGALTWFYAEELASGGGLARGICLMMAIFWFIRLLVAAFVFDVRPYLRNVFYRIGYQLTNVLFAFLPLLYGWIAMNGGEV